MKKNLNINVHQLTRVEGHGNIVVNMREGVLETAHLNIVEPPRFFEAMLKGRKFTEAAIITSRICGICSLGHQITSLKATEAALGLEVSEQTILLRKLLIMGATIQSNVLHTYFLATPDFLNAPSVFPLIATHKDVVVRALRMKRLANEIGELIAGRAVHPITPVPGGFTSIPSRDELSVLKEKLIHEALPDGMATVETMQSLASAIPQFERPTEYISLKNDSEYAFYDGDICSSDVGKTAVKNYLGITNEFIVPHSTSKHAKHNRGAYMVGALARWNNSHSQLNEEAIKAAQILGLKPDCHNPYMITIAQVVEIVHCIEESIRIINQLLDLGMKHEKPNQTPTRYGRGISATEVPRGILFHDYTYDTQGRIVAANCVIPTGQNLANIDADMQKLVPEIVEKKEPEIVHALEMLVRAYDPCISCSVHILDVSFKHE